MINHTSPDYSSYSLLLDKFNFKVSNCLPFMKSMSFIYINSNSSCGAILVIFSVCYLHHLLVLTLQNALFLDTGMVGYDIL